MKRSPTAGAVPPVAAGNPARPRPSFPARLPGSSPADGAKAGLATPSAQRKDADSTPRSAVHAGAKASVAAMPPARMAAPVRLATGAELQPARLAMVRKLEAQGIRHPAVLEALRAVDRHRFVDSALVNQAYEDTSLPIGLGQTISKPSVVARMVELLCHDRPGKLGRVLEIGTGCGYQAAVLSRVATEVYSIERLRGLHERARENLRAFRISNLHLLFGDGMLGFPTGAPYAAIIAAAGGNNIPEVWINQLEVGGRLVAPSSSAAGMQNLVVLDKTRLGVVRTELEAVNFVPLKSGIG